MVTYHVARSYHRTLKGRRIQFQMTGSGGPVFHTKLRSDNPGVIPVARGSHMHFSDPSFDGVILASAGASAFCIRRGGQYSWAIGALKFTRKIAANKRRAPLRLLRLDLFDPGALPPVLTSRPPKMNPIGAWTLDFGDRPVVASVKNALLVDAQNKEACAIMRSDERTLRIDALEAFDPIIIFAIGVGSWLCTLH
jgi:hypothetical protein